MKDGDRKQGEFKCRATVPGRRENTKPGAEMTGSVGEHATDSSQPCRKGAIRGNITALEAAYEEYRFHEIQGEVNQWRNARQEWVSESPIR